MTGHGGLHERVAVADKAAEMIITIALTTPIEDPIFTYCVTVLCHTCKLLYMSVHVLFAGWTPDISLRRPWPRHSQHRSS